MIRSLRTGVSGLKSNQVRMDVIGNNIANVNTAAFKRSRVAFNELLGQRLLGLGRSSGGSGINPASIGTGVAIGSVDQDWSQGTFEYTNVGTDLALSGDGYFIAKGGDGNVLTRAGNFTFNADGELVTAGGLPVQGWQYNPDGTLNTGQLQNIRLDLELNAAPKETDEVGIGGNLSANLDAAPLDPAADPQPLDSQITMSQVVYDGQGRAHTLVTTLQKTATNEWGVASAQLAGDANATPPVPATDLTVSAGAVTFDNAGNLTAPDPATFDITGTYPGTAGDDVALTLDVAQLTQYGGSTTATISSQNGQAAGRLVGYGIDPSGTLSLNFSNGEQRDVSKIAIAQVNNPNGLEQRGENFYGVTSAAGDLLVGRAGQEVNTSVVAGALESSNVDLANEFTDMIVTQRGYQASARVITTSDELLQELVQLKR
ncbi:flagellar hook protein FlgE [Rubrivirga sp. S365]|uniref:Flagellar hook protein FlgE n=1 Tax=Rubrivirga litoralis TaxID=3075598 RepID=A0ABU3BSU4_9BACT|nr:MULTISPECIES: flagellar hook protein FlgE [unclassified Rubrivirga]MDT0632369.1 flagellar hook protein FlgE [Rubrivirga sp. F394]MDT7857335.1 flagellar hook protein FlgE [Rubrivirga sp. S365]